MGCYQAMSQVNVITLQFSRFRKLYCIKTIKLIAIKLTLGNNHFPSAQDQYFLNVVFVHGKQLF